MRKELNNASIPTSATEYLVMGVNPDIAKIIEEDAVVTRASSAAGYLAAKNSDAGLGPDTVPETTLDRHPIFDIRTIVE